MQVLILKSDEDWLRYEAHSGRRAPDLYYSFIQIGQPVYTIPDGNIWWSEDQAKVLSSFSCGCIDEWLRVYGKIEVKEVRYEIDYDCNVTAYLASQRAVDYVDTTAGAINAWYNQATTAE